MKRSEDLAMNNRPFPFDNKMIQDVKNEWRMKLEDSYIMYDPDKNSSSKTLGIYTVSYLPGRLQYLKDNLPKNGMRVGTPHFNGDAFCILLHDIEKKQKITDLKVGQYTWRVIANNNPIESYHCVLIPDGEPQNQVMTLEYFQDLALLVESNHNITLGFNSFGAGASQNHFHSHLFFNKWSISTINNMPIQRKFFQLKETQKAVLYTNFLVGINIGHNITMSSDGIVITKRKSEHIGGIRYGVDAISGRFLTTSLEQYDTMTVSAIETILEQIAFSNR